MKRQIEQDFFSVFVESRLKQQTLTFKRIYDSFKIILSVRSALRPS